MSSWNGHWSISLQSNQRLSGYAWTSQDTRLLTSTNLHIRNSHLRPSRRSQTPVCMLAASMPACQLGLQQNIWQWQPGLLSNIQQPWAAAWPKGSSRLLSMMEHRHQPGPGLCECQSGQPTARQMCSRKAHAVTTSTLPHKATKAQSSCLQRSGKALELAQSWLEALLPSHSWIRWEIATSGHNKYWEGIPGILREPTFCSWTIYLNWLSQELCAILGERMWAPVGNDSDGAASSLLSWLKQKRQERWEEAVNSINFSHSSCKLWSTIN